MQINHINPHTPNPLLLTLQNDFPSLAQSTSSILSQICLTFALYTPATLMYLCTSYSAGSPLAGSSHSLAYISLSSKSQFIFISLEKAFPDLPT